MDHLSKNNAFIITGVLAIIILISYMVSIHGNDMLRNIVFLIPTGNTPHASSSKVNNISPKIVVGKNDFLIHLRIQKTGSSELSNHLRYDIDLCSLGDTPGYCSDRWEANVLYLGHGPWHIHHGKHSDWTALHETFGYDTYESRYHYITMVREPTALYVSEWVHLKLRATWANTRLSCNRRLPTEEELPPCYTGPDWTGVTLNEFMDCQSNLAINRQTRMLADLTLINCYNSTHIEKRDRIILKSAMDNLKNMAFFGLTEYQEYSQLL